MLPLPSDSKALLGLNVDDVMVRAPAVMVACVESNCVCILLAIPLGDSNSIHVKIELTVLTAELAHGTILSDKFVVAEPRIAPVIVFPFPLSKVST